MFSPAARFALTLDRLEGVGRVTAGRLLSAFADYEDLRRYPREQVLARIKGAPNAEQLVARLYDADAMQAHLEAAGHTLESLANKGVQVLTSRDTHWPAGLDALERSERPVVLYVYGAADVLARPVVALLAPARLTPEPYEQAQELVRLLLAGGIVPAAGASNGFDVVISKLAADLSTPLPAILVAACGLAKLAPPMRPTASATVRAGGCLVSPFPMVHGPFAHDDRERALVQAALARVCVFVEPAPDSPEQRAMRWALDAGRPVFGLAAPDHPLPGAVHPLRSSVDFDWVVAAAVQGV